MFTATGADPRLNGRAPCPMGLGRAGRLIGFVRGPRPHSQFAFRTRGRPVPPVTRGVLPVSTTDTLTRLPSTLAARAMVRSDTDILRSFVKTRSVWFFSLITHHRAGRLPDTVHGHNSFDTEVTNDVSTVSDNSRRLWVVLAGRGIAGTGPSAIHARGHHAVFPQLLSTRVIPLRHSNSRLLLCCSEGQAILPCLPGICKIGIPACAVVSLRHASYSPVLFVAHAPAVL